MTILAVGKLSKGEEAALVSRYHARMRRLKLKTLEIAESDQRREAQLILSKLTARDLVIALDERGKAIPSTQFAAILNHAEEQAQNVSLIIGGPDGLDASIRARANHVISFGAMTWPHQLARVLLAEQLYRAETILTAHPYHRS